MTGKYNRSYIDCWDKNKIKEVLQDRLKELKSKDGKSKSRVKLLRSKIAKLRKALEGKRMAGGQVAPGKSSKSGKRAVKREENDDMEDSAVDGKSTGSSSKVTSKSIGKTSKRTKKLCFGCRKRGHLLKDCRENKSETLCFKCGSKEHTLKNCTTASSSENLSSIVDSKDCTVGSADEDQKEDLPFASCFVCGQVGHLSSQCSQNPKGMFPKGSGCHFCGSVRHKKASCPQLKSKTTKNSKRAVTKGSRSSYRVENKDLNDD